MTLIEQLTASVVFVTAAAASLQVWALAAGATATDAHRQQRLSAHDAELMAVEGRLRSQAQLGPLEPDCSVAAERLRGAAEAQPPLTGVVRSLELLPAASATPLLQVRLAMPVAARGLEAERVRLYSPAALGLCGAAAALAGGN
ncbi:MAG: hypothetical protein ACK486_02560 [Cyanobacteriota bacterium]